MITNTIMSLEVISINIKVTRKLAMVQLDPIVWSPLPSTAPSPCCWNRQVTNPLKKQVMAMDELWVMSCQEWPGRPTDLEEAAHTTHHEKICPWSTKWQNGHDSLAGQMQIPICKFKSHCNPMTVGSTYNLAFEICTPPLNLLPSSSLTCPSALPQLPQRRGWSQAAKLLRKSLALSLTSRYQPASLVIK